MASAQAAGWRIQRLNPRLDGRGTAAGTASPRQERLDSVAGAERGITGEAPYRCDAFQVPSPDPLRHGESYLNASCKALTCAIPALGEQAPIWKTSINPERGAYGIRIANGTVRG